LNINITSPRRSIIIPRPMIRIDVYQSIQLYPPFICAGRLAVKGGKAHQSPRYGKPEGYAAITTPLSGGYYLNQFFWFLVDNRFGIGKNRSHHCHDISDIVSISSMIELLPIKHTELNLFQLTLIKVASPIH